MRLLVIGSGGREHALVWKLKTEDRRLDIYAAPGNPGIAELATCVPIGATDIDALVDFAQRERVDITVVGPEAPLAAGVVDRFRASRLPIFGPTRAAAAIETSKAFAKEVMREAGVPTARAEMYTDAAAARRAARQMGAPLVIKASGLAAGKGVIVATSVGEADAAIDMMLLERGMGDAGREILVEEFMEGEELSLFGITDGERVLPLVAAQDHKRLLDGDRGPNTGGMGAYAPVSIATRDVIDDAMRRVMIPTVDALRRRGTPFTGLLYAGLMLTRDGPKVVEFNCRFGDPETQAILPLIELRPTLLDLITRVAQGAPLPERLDCRTRGHAVATVVAAPGYPDKPETGEPIRLPRIDDVDVLFFHAGTRRADDGRLISAGGRVLAVTSVAPTFDEAQRLSTEYADRVDLPGKHFRSDIGWRELSRRAGAT
jgi:phosphoribosylamine--glycine ligase